MMEELIKKHLGSNTPQWIIENCKALLKEWDECKDKYVDKKPKVSTTSIISNIDWNGDYDDPLRWKGW